jgi:hypothetical protein
MYIDVKWVWYEIFNQYLIQNEILLDLFMIFFDLDISRVI